MHEVCAPINRVYGNVAPGSTVHGGKMNDIDIWIDKNGFSSPLL